MQSGFLNLKHLWWLYSTQIITDSSSKVWLPANFFRTTFSKWIIWELYVELSPFSSYQYLPFFTLQKGKEHLYFLASILVVLVSISVSRVWWKQGFVTSKDIKRSCSYYVILCDVLSRKSHQPCKNDNHHEITMLETPCVSNLLKSSSWALSCHLVLTSSPLSKPSCNPNHLSF